MTKSSRFSASLPRSTRTPLCELLAGRTRWPSRALAWYMPTMPWTWHAVNEAMLAMTSLATLTEPRGRSGIGLDPPHVHQGVEGGVLFQVLHGVTELVVAKRQLVVARQVHEIVAVTVAVKVLHGHLLDPGAGKAILVAELLVDDRPGPHVAQLGAEE